MHAPPPCSCARRLHGVVCLFFLNPLTRNVKVFWFFLQLIWGVVHCREEIPALFSPAWSSYARVPPLRVSPETQTNSASPSASSLCPRCSRCSPAFCECLFIYLFKSATAPKSFFLKKNLVALNPCYLFKARVSEVQMPGRESERSRRFPLQPPR